MEAIRERLHSGYFYTKVVAQQALLAMGRLELEEDEIVENPPRKIKPEYGNSRYGNSKISIQN